MSFTRIAAVTGGNKGIGYAITRGIALRYATSALNNGPLLLYLTARNEQRGEEAVKNIQKDEALAQAKALSKDGGLVDIKFKHVDVADERSVQDFETYIKAQHSDGIDILVNNAGVFLDGFTPEIVRQTLALNYCGTMSITQRLLPQMRQRGRIVNIASMLGKLNKYSPDITAAFRSAAASDTPTSTDNLMAQYQIAVDAGTAEKDGWPTSAYAVSKTGVIGATMCLGKQVQRTMPKRGLCMNACCPGYVKTDMTKQRGRKTVEEGAMTPVRLVLGDLDGVTGEFWESHEVSSW